jgi:Protein of unknown function (DUF1236)
MKRSRIIAASGLALLASVSLAAAQGTSTPPVNNPPGQASQNPPSQGQISLNDQQKQMIWQTLSNARNERTPTNFQASVGADVPRALRLHSFARAVTKQLPAVRGYDYAKLQNQVLIVDPKTRKVVDTVSGG